jgi:hypothetical protein
LIQIETGPKRAEMAIVPRGTFSNLGRIPKMFHVEHRALQFHFGLAERFIGCGSISMNPTSKFDRPRHSGFSN